MITSLPEFAQTFRLWRNGLCQCLYDTDVWADLMLLITSYFLRIAKNQKSVSKNTILEINFMTVKSL